MSANEAERNQGLSAKGKSCAPMMSRRSLCYGIGASALLLGLGAVKFVGSDSVLRPPGGQDEERLLACCIRCQKCLEACPHDVIVPTHVEDGLLATRTPTLDYSNGWCDWCAESNGGRPRCVEVCPTGALSLPDGATEQSTILGVAKITSDWCLAYKLIGCKSCYDACPFDAIFLDADGKPSVVAERCNGCGACEAACVSLSSGSIAAGASRRAIVVEPLQG